MASILVIEDEKDIRETIEQVLTLEGYSVTTATNGQDGIQLAMQNEFDLIICDVMMPRMDGHAVVQNLRSNPSTSTVPFIFLTARMEKNDIRLGMNLGADDYLTKPFMIDELLEAVSSKLKKGMLIQKNAEDKLNSLRHSISFSLPHELNTPLTSLIGFAHTLKEDIDDIGKKEISEIADYILENAERLKKSIGKYLLYSHLEMTLSNAARKKELTGFTSNINSDMFQNLLSLSEFNKRTHDFKVNVHAATVKIHDEYLSSLVEELLQNSIMYSQPGTQIEISGEKVNGTYILTIKDKGQGIKKEQLKNIGAFMQFERDVKEQQGTGMGLAICKKISELFNIDFKIESNEKEGTSITLVFNTV